MDSATVVGMLIAWGALIVSVWWEGGDLRALINLPAALLVFGGTVGAALIGSNMEDVRGLPASLRRAFREKTIDLAEIAVRLIRMAEKARREGLLVLEAEARRLEDPFLQRGLRMAIDKTDPELIREILTNEIYCGQVRERVGERILTTMGGFAPTLGIIGTVMGLIHMLSSLSDPGRMGPLIAGAFLATFYGVAGANLIFLPLGNKLRAHAAEQALAREVMLEGILAIQAGDNPRIVEQKLIPFLPLELRAALPNLSGAVVTGNFAVAEPLRESQAA